MNQRAKVALDSSLPGMFYRKAEQWGSRPAVYYRHGGLYTPVTWSDLKNAVTETAGYLIAAGVNKGDRVAVYSHNRWEWWAADMGALAAGAVTVPVHATNSAEETAFVLNHSGAKICFVGGKDLLEIVKMVTDRCPGLEAVVVFDDAPAEGVITYDMARATGREKVETENVRKRLSVINEKDFATFMYTSGTTGDPKGVMLTHGNLMNNVHQVYGEVASYFSEKDFFLSFMPLSHSLERTCGYYFPVMAGCSVYFAESLATIARDLQEVRPTILISAPRIYEKIHAGILARVSEASPLRQKLFAWATRVAANNLPFICRDKRRRGLFALAYGMADTLVLGKLKKLMGMDRLKFAISGGGPLSRDDAEFFLGMGLRILEGYGLTETSPVASFNRPWYIQPGSVGSAAPGTELLIEEKTGEVLIRGPQVMSGYYENPEATRGAFNEAGYFRSGDIGAIDADGYLRITGRIKDIIITAGGKNISPQNIENSIKGSPYIEQIAVVGDRRKYLAALVIPSFEALKRWGKETGLAGKTNAEIAADEKVRALIQEEISRHTAHYSRIEQIKKFALLEAEWSQATGELTPSLKVKRRVIEAKYREEIEAMYLDE